MTQDDIDEWLENPITKYVFTYWADSAAEEVELLKDQLLAGSILSDVEQARVASVCITLERVRDITFNEIENFYSGDEDESTRQSSNYITRSR